MNQHPEFPFVVAHNRDEAFDRDCTPMTPGMWHTTGAADGLLLAGKDLQAGGAWLGLRRLPVSGTRACRFATILNLVDRLEPCSLEAPSRGTLPVRFLLSPPDVQPSDFTERVACEPSTEAMAGFVLICATFGSPDGLVRASVVRNCVSSTSNATRVVHLTAGCHALSNDGLLDSSWFRVRHGSQLFSNALLPRPNASQTMLQEKLVEDLLCNDAVPEGGSDGTSCTKPVFISPYRLSDDSNGLYGTRASTVVVCGADGIAHVTERCFDRKPPPMGEQKAYRSLREHGFEDWHLLGAESEARRARL